METTLKSLISLIIFCGLVGTTQAQVKTFYDDFKNNEEKWYVKEGKTASYAVKDGHYFIASRKEKGFSREGIKFSVDPRKNFLIETAVTELSGNEKNGSGLYWGSRNSKNYYRFVISSKGYFTVDRFKNGKFQAISKWTKSEAVKKGFGQANKLTIQKNGGGVKFLINGQVVYTISLQDFTYKYPFFGKFVGMITYWTKEAKFDYFKYTRVSPDIHLIKNSKQGFKKEALKGGVNSEYNDILPVVTPDAKTLYFVRKRDPGNIKVGKQDIWYAQRKADGTWGQAKNMGKPVNSSFHNGTVAASADGNTLIVSAVYKPDGSFKKGGVSITHRTNQGWELPKEIKIKNFYNKNGYVGRCMSADRRKMIFAIERDDSYGDLDLYISFLQKDGTWSEPKNMGVDLNTFGTENEPFLAADNKTLYFSSDGLSGYGNSDIFVTRRLDDTWTKWSKPENLGKEVNSSRSENSYKITAEGDYAYMVAYTNKQQKFDIYRIKLHESAKPEPVVMVYGKVLNRKTNRPLSARILYNDLNTGKLAGIARSNPSDGSYKIILPYSKAYDFLATRRGFYSVGNHLDLKASSSFKAIKRNLYLAPIQVGAKIRLNNLFFDTGKSTLKAISYGELNRLIRSMKRYPAMKIEIAGHTDSQGNPGKNMTLSRARANAVLSYLSAKGIPTSRLKSKGYGQTKPVANNNTTLGRARNRRVEFMILAK
ncbi:MAG TPA: hypothetical protein DCS93_10275 [Microscillaceae bacterium]|nr:hypothetical protein [Microscillaceae bacterium]